MLLPHTPSTLAPHASPTLLPQIPGSLRNASTIMGAVPPSTGSEGLPLRRVDRVVGLPIHNDVLDDKDALKSVPGDE